MFRTVRLFILILILSRLIESFESIFFFQIQMASSIARRLVILGAPGSGKGTIASRIVKTYGMGYIVVSDLLRQSIKNKARKLIFQYFIDFHGWFTFI